MSRSPMTSPPILAHATYNGDCNIGCSFAAGTLTWTIPSIAGTAASVVLTFSVTLDDTFPTGTTHLPNVVVVTGPGSNCAGAEPGSRLRHGHDGRGRARPHAVKLVAINDGAFAPTSTANPGDTAKLPDHRQEHRRRGRHDVPVSDDIAPSSPMPPTTTTAATAAASPTAC